MSPLDGECYVFGCHARATVVDQHRRALCDDCDDFLNHRLPDKPSLWARVLRWLRPSQNQRLWKQVMEEQRRRRW